MIRPAPLRLTASLIVLAVVTTACASNSSLTVAPTRGQDSGQVQRDRAECDALAQRYRDRWVFLEAQIAGAVAGTVLGAGMGLVALAMSGRSASASEAPGLLAGAVGGGAAIGFVIGNIAGTVVGVKEHRKREEAYVNRYARCLDERGYRVSP